MTRTCSQWAEGAQDEKYEELMDENKKHFASYVVQVRRTNSDTNCNAKEIFQFESLCRTKKTVCFITLLFPGFLRHVTSLARSGKIDGIRLPIGFLRVYLLANILMELRGFRRAGSTLRMS